jgi:hypothetical protein
MNNLHCLDLAHCDIPVNEAADKLAQRHVTFAAPVQTITKAQLLAQCRASFVTKWQKELPDSNPAFSFPSSTPVPSIPSSV